MSDLHVPVVPSQKLCDECGRQATAKEPNLAYTVGYSVVVISSGVLCHKCLNVAVADINQSLKRQK